MANASKPDGWTDPTAGTPTFDRLRRAYEQGDTIIFNDVQLYCSLIADLARDIERELSFPVNVNAYLTPSHSQGFEAHFDCQDGIILQIEGRKRWQLFEITTQLPVRDDFSRISLGSIEKPVFDQSLQPGDALYIPRGQIHQGATDGVPSLHLTVTISSYRIATIIESAFRGALAGAVQEALQLRRSLPLGWMRNGLGPTTQTEIVNFAIGVSRGMDIGGAFDLLAESFLSRQAPLPDAFRDIGREASELSLDSRVIIRRGVIHYVAHLSDNELELRSNVCILRLPRACRIALEELLSGNIVAIKDLPDLSNSARLILARRLLEERLVAVHPLAIEEDES